MFFANKLFLWILKGNEIITEEEGEDEEEIGVGFCEQIALAAGNIGTFVYKNSYIFTNVVMMAWSIIYHSWLGFVLLIWANLIWIIPNQRKNMLRSSPFLVVYAEFLLLATYLFGMNLTNDELPANVDVNGINLPQIGFIKYIHYPIGPIVLKSAFTVMFWASLRQMLQERAAEKQTTALADICAPLQLTGSNKSRRFFGFDFIFRQFKFCSWRRDSERRNPKKSRERICVYYKSGEIYQRLSYKGLDLCCCNHAVCLRHYG